MRGMAPPATPVSLSSASLLPKLLISQVCASFPSHAEDFGAWCIDLTEVLVSHPQATFILRVRGHSMMKAGVFDNDLLMEFRATVPRHRHLAVAVAVVDDDCTLERLYQLDERIKRQAANPTFPLSRWAVCGDLIQTATTTGFFQT